MKTRLHVEIPVKSIVNRFVMEYRDPLVSAVVVFVMLEALALRNNRFMMNPTAPIPAVVTSLKVPEQVAT